MADLATVCHMINRTPLDLTVRELVWRLRNHISIAMPRKPHVVTKPDLRVLVEGRCDYRRRTGKYPEDIEPVEARSPVSDPVRGIIRDLRETGMSQPRIAERLGISQSTVSRILQSFGGTPS